jgi:hypothetical protein
MPVIDADAHVHECDRTWDFMKGEDLKFKPGVVAAIDSAAPRREHWLIDGRVRGRGFGNVGATTPRPYRELSDIPGRLRHMDDLAIDIQVLSLTPHAGKRSTRSRVRPLARVQPMPLPPGETGAERRVRVNAPTKEHFHA